MSVEKSKDREPAKIISSVGSHIDVKEAKRQLDAIRLRRLESRSGNLTLEQQILHDMTYMDYESGIKWHDVFKKLAEKHTEGLIGNERQQRIRLIDSMIKSASIISEHISPEAFTTISHACESKDDLDNVKDFVWNMTSAGGEKRFIGTDMHDVEIMAMLHLRDMLEARERGGFLHRALEVIERRFIKPIGELHDD